MPDAAKKIKLINWCWSGDAGYRLEAKQTRHDNDKIKRQGWQWWKWQRQWRWMTGGCGCDGTAEWVGRRRRGFRGGSSCGSCSLTRHSWRDLSTGIIRLPLRLRLPVMLELRRSSFMTTTMMMRSTPFVYQISMRWYVHVCNDVMEVAYHHERCLCAQLGWISLNYYCTLFIFIYLWYHKRDFMIFHIF